MRCGYRSTFSSCEKSGCLITSEIAIGALATGGVQLLDDALIAESKIPTAMVSFLIVKETLELQRREELYRAGRPPPELSDRSIILVDDGVATGYTMRVAILALRKLVRHT